METEKDWLRGSVAWFLHLSRAYECEEQLVIVEVQTESALGSEDSLEAAD